MTGIFQHGKHVRIDPNHPEALGICDRTGFVFKRKDLVKQFEWYGDELQWTGFLVGRPYVDIPNESHRPLILPADPLPTVNPRPQQPQTITWSQNPLPVWSLCNYFSWSSLDDFEDGQLALTYGQRQAQLETYSQGVPG